MLKSLDSLSSSDDEINAEALREACDEKFLPHSLFSKDSTRSSENVPEVKDEAKPSLRIAERSDNFESFGVSQSFKNFVAKKLDAMLDKTIVIQDVDNFKQEVPRKRKKRTKSRVGIMLLSSSDTAMIAVEEPDCDERSGRIKPPKFTKEIEAKNIARCQEVAVDPALILSKAETKAWNERQRGNVFKYKRARNGTLIEQP